MGARPGVPCPRGSGPALGLRQGREVWAQQPEACKVSAQHLREAPAPNFPPALGTPRQAQASRGAGAPQARKRTPGRALDGPVRRSRAGVGVRAGWGRVPGREGTGLGKTPGLLTARCKHLPVPRSVGQVTLCPQPPGCELEGRAPMGCCSAPSPLSVITGSGGRQLRQEKRPLPCGHTAGLQIKAAGVAAHLVIPRRHHRQPGAQLPTATTQQGTCPQPQPHPAASGGCPSHLGTGDGGGPGRCGTQASPEPQAGPRAQLP